MRRRDTTLRAQGLLESGKLNSTSMTTLLLRKGDWHDTKEFASFWNTGGPECHDALGKLCCTTLQRDNRPVIALLLDHGEILNKNVHNGVSAASIAARRGRGDVL
jgi:hypothetical protein